MTTLTVQEQINLSQYEERIERGLSAFYEAGQALGKIRDYKLFRDSYRSFEAYCQDRWGFEYNYAYKLIQASEVFSNLKTCTTVQVLPDNERQTRPLYTLKSEQQPEAWEAAVAIAPESKPTANHVARAADAVKAKPASPFQVGKSLTVLDEGSAHYGQPVEVVDVQGVVVQAKTQSGQTVPFLCNELSDGQPVAPKPEQSKPQPKVDRTEGLESALDAAQARVDVLESVLSRLCVAARAGNLSDDLLSEAESLI